MRQRRLAAFVMFGLLAVPGSLQGQVSLHAHADIGWAEHAVLDGGMRVRASGAFVGGAFGAALRDRFELWGEVTGGRLVSSGSPATDDRSLAEVQLVGGVKVRPWLTLQGGPVVRSYSNSLARQRWTTVRVGAQANVPLSVERIGGVLRGYWVPVAKVSGLPAPEVALAAGIGVEWRGSRLAVSTVYTLERYDFPVAGATRRLEQLSSLQLRATMRVKAIGGSIPPKN